MHDLDQSTFATSNRVDDRNVFKRSDESLIRKAVQGDEQAWQQLVGRYQAALYYYGVRLLGDAEDARDLLQDVLMVVCRNLAEFRGDSSFKTWLFGIANYRAIDLLRKRRPHDDVDDLHEQLADEAACVSQQYSGLQEQLLVQKLLLTLPVEQRMVLELKFYQQFTFDEIATQLAISSNTVKSRFYSALDKMKVQLEAHDVGQSTYFC